MLHAGVALVYAVHDVALPAMPAVSATAAEEADADALANDPAFNAFADQVDASDGFMAGYPRPLDRQCSFHRRQIRMAHATGLDTHAYMPRWRTEQRLFDEFQLAW